MAAPVGLMRGTAERSEPGAAEHVAESGVNSRRRRGSGAARGRRSRGQGGGEEEKWGPAQAAAESGISRSRETGRAEQTAAEREQQEPQTRRSRQAA